MGTNTLSSLKSGRNSGRPKGVPSPLTRRMLDLWDSMQRENPKLNKEALLDLVSESVFGSRLNASIRRKDKTRLKRALQRHGKL